ncbi:ABC transporter substrate-binding protein [Salicibibacter cibarius]|uniref:ABC transporter substrate-binding protein n=1 Tax=Salicibibacter cibarius TaxID=2743000 RepID=A0A7T7CBT2_9BACI|nr:ABC transporter substrate-binding protein [Salicibibacter cibarius]QQK76159.1 ABC transporter substrate-binding protein [Salicibibacter cibarius]
MLKKATTWLTFPVFLLMIGGCGTEDASSSDREPEENEEASDTEGEEETDERFPRTVEHEEGETVIEEEPQRVALGDVNIIDYFLALDELPVGARIDTIDRSPALQEIVESADPEGSITSLGGQINMETLIGLEPDLIIDSEGKAENYERNSKVADTIVLDGSNDRTVRLEQLADIFGKEDLAESLIEDLETLKDETKENIAPNADETVLFLRANGRDFTVLTPEENGLLYEEMGLETAGTFDDLGQVGVEAVSDADPDHIFIMEARREMDADNIGALIDVWDDNSVWNNIDAVQNDQMYILDPLVADDFFAGWHLELEALNEHLGE